MLGELKHTLRTSGVGWARHGSVKHRPLQTARKASDYTPLLQEWRRRVSPFGRPSVPPWGASQSFSDFRGPELNPQNDPDGGIHSFPTEASIRQQTKKRRVILDVQGRSWPVDSLALRDACSCKLCVDSSTTQKLFNTVDIPTDIRATLHQENPDGSFSVSWASDIPGFEGHISQYPPGFLSSRTDRNAVVRRAQRENPRIPWSKESLIEAQITFEFDRYVNDPSTFQALMKSLMQSGMAIVSNVPADTGSVGCIAGRIGPLMKTIYGETWDVRSVESPKNVADRDSDLDFHMDLLYYKQPPRLQLLHCLKQSHQGGESLFTDGFRAVSNLGKIGLVSRGLEGSDGWQRTVAALMVDEVPYHYKNNGQWLARSHPTIVLSDPVTSPDRRAGKMRNPEWLNSEFRALRWSPPFQAPFQLEKGKFRTRYDVGYWLAGARMLQKELQQNEAIFQTKLCEGSCVIFDNWRVLHARKGFSGGERWLRGAYIGEDEFLNRVLELASQPFEKRAPNLQFTRYR